MEVRLKRQPQVLQEVQLDDQPEHHQPAWDTTIGLYRRDVKVHRQLRHADGTPRPRPGGGVRGKIQSFSPAAARRLRFLLRNAGPLPFVLHLTYPGNFPTDGARVKRDWKRLREWLVQRGLGGVWVLEFQQHGGPHFMVLLNGTVEKEAVAARWAAIVGSGDPDHLRAGTRVERVRHPAAMIQYMVKAAGDPQKQVPAEYIQVGKLWGRFGGVKAEPQQVLQGSREELAPVVRGLRGLENSRRRQRSRARTGPIGSRPAPRLRDRGVGGWTGWDLAPAAARCLDRLAPGLLQRELAPRPAGPQNSPAYTRPLPHVWCPRYIPEYWELLAAWLLGRGGRRGSRRWRRGRRCADHELQPGMALPHRRHPGPLGHHHLPVKRLTGVLRRRPVRLGTPRRRRRSAARPP